MKTWSFSPRKIADTRQTETRVNEKQLARSSSFIRDRQFQAAG